MTPKPGGYLRCLTSLHIARAAHGCRAVDKGNVMTGLVATAKIDWQRMLEAIKSLVEAARTSTPRPC
jgi:hypothetical protein